MPIFVADAAIRAHLFADAQSVPTISRMSLDPIIGPTSYNGTLTTHAFYLYPTTLATTEIAMEVEYIDLNPGECHKDAVPIKTIGCLG